METLGERSQLDPVPPLPEQQRIVGILDEAFEGIATAKANAEKNLQNARALFESHLQSVFTQRGKGWVEKTLEEIARPLAVEVKTSATECAASLRWKISICSNRRHSKCDHTSLVFSNLQRSRACSKQAMAEGNNLHHHRGEHRGNGHPWLQRLLSRQRHWRGRESQEAEVASSNTSSNHSRRVSKRWERAAPKPTSTWARSSTNGFRFHHGGTKSNRRQARFLARRNPTPRPPLPAEARRAGRVEEVAAAPSLQRSTVGMIP